MEGTLNEIYEFKFSQQDFPILLLYSELDKNKAIKYSGSLEIS